MNDNPLLDFSGLPRFASIRAAHVAPAVARLLADARATVEQVATDTREPTWASVAEPIADALDRLHRAWGAVRHLNAVVSTPGIRDAYNGNLPAITAFYTDLGQDERLYARYRALAASPSYASLDPAKRRVIDNELRDFRLSGAELPPAEKARFKAIQEELASISARYDDNVLDATNDYALYIDDPKRLAGLPDDVVAEAHESAKAAGREGWRLTIRMPCYLPVMKYADDRELRAELHRAHATRASDLGAKREWDNGPLIERVLELRREAAQLLGYPHYAEVSLVPKMAKDTADVLAFLRDLARRARPYAERDLDELTSFARAELGLAKLEPWDIAWATEKLQNARYAFSDETVRRYFPEDRVLSGLFRVVETIYGVRIRESRAETWHPTVRFFDIVDRHGATIAQFYFDNYAREGKQGGAWMDDAINRRRGAGGVQIPVAYLTCNLPAPVAGKPALFTHDDVITVFHEFGHGLHQMLTQVEVLGVSGIEGVEWDAVELPSQFMENFCWEWEVLRHMTSHVDTGEALPRELFDRMIAAKNFQSGLATVRQLEFGLFDMLVHSDYVPGGGGRFDSPQAVLDAVRAEVRVLPVAPYDRFMHAFSHVFAGGYAAGYYSYKWAEVLSADAFSLFEELGVLSPEAGARFRDEVLAKGGSRPAMESFVAFRGREPQLDALLRHNGMTTSLA